MDTSSYCSSASLRIDARPEELYALVSDVSSMGRWSPVCTGGRYDDDGVWFTGTNSLGGTTWETRCRVEVADPGREFAFVVCGPEGRADAVRWGFVFTPVEESCTEVTQTWQVLPRYPEGAGLDEQSAVQVLEMMKDLALRGMPETLAALKREVEGAAPQAG